jgi:glycosyltransferase involved in cell wall biosynthesis
MKYIKNKILFITDKVCTDFDIPGGVQLCTREFIEYLNNAGYEVELFKIINKIDWKRKLKIKFGLDVYDTYDFKKQAGQIIEKINELEANIVVINQLNLTPIIKELKRNISCQVKFIGLSHGNESGDYLHDVSQNRKKSFIKVWKLGSQLVHENYLFKILLDGLIVISEQEISINQWIGANNIFFLPRLLKSSFIEWKPKKGLAGFVGTLDHLPNKIGVESVADHLKKNDFRGTLSLVGGPKSVGEEFQKKYTFIDYKGILSEDDLQQHIATWSVFLNPVFWYSRGSSTKLAQAINWGIPIISTPAGRRGYFLSNEAIVLPDHSPKTFADVIKRALTDSEYLVTLKTSTVNNAKSFNIGYWSKNLKEFIEQLPIKNKLS